MRWLLWFFLIWLLIVAEWDHRAHGADKWQCYHSDEFAAFKSCGREKETTGQRVGKIIVVRKHAIAAVTEAPRKECTKIATMAGHAVFVEGEIEWVLQRLHKDARHSAPCLPQ